MTQMRSARYDHYGPAEVLHTVTGPRPLPGPSEVLVRVHGASVSGGELLIRSGKLRRLTRLKLPQGAGVDFAGEVTALGSHTSGLEIGNRVWGLLPDRRFGAIAEYVAVPQEQVATAPAGVDLVHAAALPAVATTAVTALRAHAHLQPGERLLVRGATGGVGTAAVQLAHAWGAHVTALASARNLDWVKQLGADEALDHRATPPGALGRFDVVLDVVGTDLPAYRHLLTRRGRMVALAVDPDALFRSVAYVLASSVHGRRRVRAFSNKPTHEDLVELSRLVETRALRPVVDTTFPPDGLADAHRSLEAGGVRGKHVIDLLQPS